MYMRYTEKEKNLIKKYYPLGGCKETIKYLNRSTDSIRHTAKKMGIKTICRQNLCDINDFKYISTEKMAYLLGFLWGDGHISYKPRYYFTTLSIKKEDGNNIKKIFDKRWKISHKKPQKKEWSPQIIFKLNHKELATFLKDHDYTVKSLASPSKILNKIHNKLKNHFFRGWFDADGHFSSSVTICGTYYQNWECLEKLSKKLKLKYKIYQWKSKNTKFSRFEITGKESYSKFLSYIYKDANFKLDRKFLKYQKLIAKIG